MNTTTAQFDIEEKYIVKLQGKYNRGVFICNYCNQDIKQLYANVMGFARYGWAWFYVIECPFCFEKFYYHAREDGYKIFLRQVKNGNNRFYPPKLV